MPLAMRASDAFTSGRLQRTAFASCLVRKIDGQGRCQSMHSGSRAGQSAVQNFPAQMLFCLAQGEGCIEAMAFFFRDGEALYGRHWGAAREHDGLHFELCCHQGVEYAIREKLSFFDAGVQGEHKLLRGFEPSSTQSMHWFAHEGFRAAIADYLKRESAMMASELEQLGEHDGYREIP